MHLLGIPVIVLQVICAVHALKTGRAYWWLWIILLLPGIGGLVYFFAEMLPDLQRSSTVRRVGIDLVTVVDPGRSLRRLEEEVEVADTVRNRRSLARGYLRAGRYDEAVELLRSCLKGVFEGDVGLSLELAYALFLSGAYEEAKQRLEQLDEAELGIRAPERNLLYARTLEQMGDVDAALGQYERIVRQSSGEETRCRYALLLEKAGQTEKAREAFGEIVRRARRSPRYYRRAQKPWIDVAKQHLGR
ncbi:MAG TPA: tetratricopeptide repeat protein [Thermoguttaceae bacterium]|nr:tetratricopeptide repeat protein [Thermoguttaceae bacterium]